MSLRQDQYAALLEGSLRELLRITAAARTDRTCVAVEQALEGSLAEQWRTAEERARKLLACKP